MQPKKTLEWLQNKCPICDSQVNSWDKRLSKALGYKNITCEKCIAKEYDVTVEELRETAEHHFGMTPCLGL